MTAPVHEGWSMPIGIVMIVFGAFAGLASVGRVFGAIFASVMPVPTESGMASYENAYMEAQIAGGALLVLAAIIGTVAGIGLVSKKRWALGLALIWAAAKLVALIPIAVVDGLAQQAMFEAMSQSGTPMPGFVGSGMAVASGAMAFLFAGALPIFMLAFCGRPRARDAWNARFAEAPR